MNISTVHKNLQKTPVIVDFTQRTELGELFFLSQKQFVNRSNADVGYRGVDVLHFRGPCCIA